LARLQGVIQMHTGYKEKKSWETSLSEEDTMATDAGAGPDVTAFERIGVPNVPYPPYNQLDMQIVGLRAQLMLAEEQLRRTEDMLRRARGTGAEGG
jgi:hypothetical protein